jgi:predicted aspartyl protease
MPASYDYDTKYEPPAPTIPVGLSRSGETSASQEIVALVDTGADATMLPVDVLKSAKTRYVQQRLMRGVMGEPTTVNLYLAAIHVAGHVIHGIRAIAGPEGSEAIIGRDVLNRLEITLNGPAHEVWIA